MIAHITEFRYTASISWIVLLYVFIAAMCNIENLLEKKVLFYIWLHLSWELAYILLRSQFFQFVFCIYKISIYTIFSWHCFSALSSVTLLSPAPHSYHSHIPLFVGANLEGHNIMSVYHCDLAWRIELDNRVEVLLRLSVQGSFIVCMNI